MRLRLAVSVCLTLALFASCGGSTPPTTEARLEDPDATEDAPGDHGAPGTPADATTGDKKGESKADKGPAGKGDDPAPGGSDGAGETAGPTGSGGSQPGSEGSPGGGGGRQPGSTPSGGGGGHGGGGAALFPASGKYVFAQNGYEEFCAGTCQREKLPPRQSVTSSLSGRSGGTATVVTEMRSSDSRLTRTTTRFTKSSADIMEVYVKFSYSGYQFNQTYRPSPPVESIRFPIANGDSWNASWKGDVSGDYRASVQGRETVTVNGRAVEAAKLQTTTRFRGDFDGTANATLWVDPRTKAIVKTAGNLAVDSNFGSYSTGFATTLRSGPGY